LRRKFQSLAQNLAAAVAADSDSDEYKQTLLELADYFEDLALEVVIDDDLDDLDDPFADPDAEREI